MSVGEPTTLLAANVLGMLAQTNNFGDTREGAVAGPLALLVIVVLGAATVFLIRNMNKRLKKLPTSFGEEIPLKKED